ncbi:MAG: F0F1 ATP synthase subunit B [Chloroflexota bacterium]
MEILAVAQSLTGQLAPLAVQVAEGEGGGGLTINFFWIIVSAINFIVFFAIVYKIALVPVGRMLRDRRERIEQGLKDADAARRDRESAADQRQGIIAEARREASDIVVRGQRVSDEAREKGVAETQAELERMRERAVVEIDAERLRALVDVRAQVAELALLAAGKVVGETMNDAREKRLVKEFLTQVSTTAPSGDERN